jgi:hypothetical protein
MVSILHNKESVVELEINLESINWTPSVSCGRLSVLIGGVCRELDGTREVTVKE